MDKQRKSHRTLLSSCVFVVFSHIHSSLAGYMWYVLKRSAFSLTKTIYIYHICNMCVIVFCFEFVYYLLQKYALLDLSSYLHPSRTDMLQVSVRKHRKTHTRLAWTRMIQIVTYYLLVFGLAVTTAQPTTSFCSPKIQD